MGLPPAGPTSCRVFLDVDDYLSLVQALLQPLVLPLQTLIIAFLPTLYINLTEGRCTSIIVTGGYAHLSPTHKKAAVDALEKALTAQSKEKAKTA